MNSNKRSQRTYPDRICPFCKATYVPTDSRQQYCCRQHQINFNNDRRKEQKAPLMSFQRKLEHNRTVLEKLWQRGKTLKWSSIPQHLLDYEGFDKEVYLSMQMNEKTKQPVFWILGFGIEAASNTPGTFIIYKI